MDNTLIQELKTWQGNFDSRFTKLSDQISAVQKQADAIDTKMQKSVIEGGGGGDGGGIARMVWDSPEFKAFAQTGRGRVAIPIPRFQEKTAVTGAGVGLATTGVVGIGRVPGIVPAPMETFRVRQLLRVIPASAGIVDYVRVTAYSQASPQTEASDKLEASMTISADSERIRTLSHWIPASKQVLSDVDGLQECINVHLLAGLFDEEDAQILNGADTGDNFNGLITQATAWDTSLVSASDGYEWADCLGRAMQQVQTAKHRVTGIILHPQDWWKIILHKDTTGRYVYGDPATMPRTQLWSVPVAVTTSMTAGTFLVGDFQSGAALHVNMDAVIDVSDSHSDYFIKNLLAIRVEERAALVCYKATAFVTGSFQQSPA